MYIIAFFIQLSLSMLTKNVNLDKESSFYPRKAKVDVEDPCYCVDKIEQNGMITKLLPSYNSDFSFSPPETCQGITIRGISINAGFDCNFRKVDLSQTQITFIDSSSFNGCYNISVLILPNTIKTIGLDAFRSSIITELHIPASLESFDGAFNACNKLAAFTIDDQNPFFRVESNIVFSKDFSRIIRATINIGQTEDIPHHDQVTELVDYSFSGTKIRKYKGTHNLLIIGKGVFELCLELFEVILIDTQVKSIKRYCFKKSKIDYMILPQMLEVIEEDSFRSCPITSIIIPRFIKDIQSSSFSLLEQQKEFKVYYFGDPSFDDRDIFSGSACPIEIFVPYSYKYKTFNNRKVTVCNLDEMYFRNSKSAD